MGGGRFLPSQLMKGTPVFGGSGYSRTAWVARVAP
jgi:hypothetical protein